MKYAGNGEGRFQDKNKKFVGPCMWEDGNMPDFRHLTPVYL